MVDWCRENLPFAEVAVNESSPPLPNESSTFDLVYALSVFTHLTEEAQRSWIHECFRVLKPGGHLLISTLGEHYLSLGRLSAYSVQSDPNARLILPDKLAGSLVLRGSVIADVSSLPPSAADRSARRAERGRENPAGS